MVLFCFCTPVSELILISNRTIEKSKQNKTKTKQMTFSVVKKNLILSRIRVRSRLIYFGLVACPVIAVLRRGLVLAWFVLCCFLSI